MGLRKALRRKQERHARVLARIERTTARLERLRARLGELESGIADLEHRVAEPRARRSVTGEVGKGPARARLIFNPNSGRDEERNGQRLSLIVRSLRAHGIEASVGVRTSSKAARTLARDAVRDGLPLVVVAAGDGTVGDVAGQLVGTKTTLAIVPIGTMNNVARSLGVPLDIERACALAGMGTTRHIDIGRVHTNRDPKDEYFLECAGVGLAAIGALAGQAFEKRRWRVLPRALRRFFESRLGRVQIEVDGNTIEASTRIVTVCNAPLMGNNMLAAPGAKMDDGQLDVRVYDGMGDGALISHFMAASSHRPEDVPAWRARKVRIVTEEEVLANADMRVASERTEVEIEVQPAALTMIVGNGIGLTLPVQAAPEAPALAGDTGNGDPQDASIPPTPIRT